MSGATAGSADGDAEAAAPAGDAATGAADDSGGGADLAAGDVAAAPTAAEPTVAVPALSMSLSVALGAVAAAFFAAGSLVAGATALVALSLLFASLLLVSRRLCRLAGAVFVLAVVAGGVTAAPTAPLVGGTILALAAWDVADHGLGLAVHVGREAATTRNELVQAAASLAVGAIAGGVAFLAFLLARGGQPATALAFLLLGAVVLLVALRE